MKEVIITFVIAMAVSCWVNGGGLPKYPFKAGVAGVAQPGAPSGMKRGEGMIPDLAVTDGYRGVYMMTQVGDRDNDQPTDFPMQGIQQ